jgi:Tol biopolymer transport system component
VLFANLTGAGGGIFVSSLDGSDARQIGTDVLPGVHKHPDWSPDGQRVVFVDEATEAMYIAHLDGSATEKLAVCDQPGCDYPAWSPDGEQIAFSRVESQDGTTGPAAVGIYVLTLKTGAVDRVVRLARPLLADVPRWSPDGSSLVFGVDKMDQDAYETGAALATVPVTGGEPRFLTAFHDFGYAPDWSWARNEIVFSTDIRSASRDFDPMTAASDLYVIHPDGSGLHKVTDAAKGQVLRSPRWSPDGSEIMAYDESVPGGVRIDPDTGRIRPFVTTGTQFRPQLRPMG